MYNDTVLDHFANPRNVGSFPNADGIGQSGNPIDGDKITIYIKVHNDILTDVRFKTFGCGAAIAASSMLTVLAVGKPLAEGLKLTNDDVAEALGGLPSNKLLCSNIAADALHAAINDYTAKQKNQPLDHPVIAEENDGPSLGSHEAIGRLKDTNQIQRYLRHIIMPDIGGAGQQKLLETQVLICAPDLETCDVLLSYLTAVGIGHITCFFKNSDGWESDFAHFHDLNPDVKLELIEEISGASDFNIIIGDFFFSSRMADLLVESVPDELSPTFISIIDPWQGCLNLSTDSKSVKSFLDQVEKKRFKTENQADSQHFAYRLGLVLSCAFVGSLLTIELVKARLQIGVVLNDVFYFDLWNTSFENNFFVSDRGFIHLDYGSYPLKNALADANVLTIGAGGLSCPANLVLAKAGVKKLSLIDFDHVEISNLNRQILHSTSRIGLLKVESAKLALEAIHPDIQVNTYSGSFTKENARDIIKKHDLVIDGLDNLPTRYLLNDACYFEKKPLLEAGALAYYGQATTIIPDQGPCFRCLFPESPSQTAGSCSETGVLGPVPGLMGILQAIEAIKLIIGMPSSLQGKLLMVDVLETSFDIFSFKKYVDCPLCGSHPTIHELGEYTFVCEEAKQ